MNTALAQEVVPSHTSEYVRGRNILCEVDRISDRERVGRIRPATGRASTTLPHVAPGADPAFQQAMDKLMLQVNGDNVLAVHRAFQTQADQLRAHLQNVSTTTRIGLCGLDPVSADVAGPNSIGGKVAALVQVHWRHCEELETVASLLRATARSYGLNENAIADSLTERAGG